MKKIYKVLIWIASILAVFVIGVYAYMMSAFPKVAPAKDLKFEHTAEMIARGEYLANHVTVCMDCHSNRDWEHFSGPLMSGTLGRGGDIFDEKSAGVPGTITAKNITPFGVGSWTDGELYRVITTGVNRKNEPLFPLMPYTSYRFMDPEDVKSIIAYVRTLHSINFFAPDTKLNFPVNLIIRTVPQEAAPQKRPADTNSVAYGKYMTTIAGCADCHTPAEKGNPILEKRFAGGFEFFNSDYGTVRSANITPDENTGIGKWTEDEFVKRFKFYNNPENISSHLKKGDFQTAMPWTMYAGMKENDLRAIYRYLRTVKPVKNTINKFTSISQAGK